MNAAALHHRRLWRRYPEPAGRPLTYAETILADAPARYWRLGDSGSPYLDSSGNGVSATLAFGAIANGVGGAIAGDSDKAITYAATSRLDSPAVDYETVSVECWARWTTTTESTLVEHWDGVNPRYPFALRVNLAALAGRIGMGAYDGTVNPFADSAAGWNDGQWHHIVGTRDAKGTLAIYVDGALRGTAPDTTVGTTRNGEHVNLGIRGNGSAPYVGSLDEVAIYPAVLTAEQIRQHYNRAKGL